MKDISSEERGWLPLCPNLLGDPGYAQTELSNQSGSSQSLLHHAWVWGQEAFWTGTDYLPPTHRTLSATVGDSEEVWAVHTVPS